MSPADELKHEHKTILMVLGAAERKIAEWKVAGRVDRPYMAEMVDFFMNFIDRCHHTKEEKHYFKKMTDRNKEAVLSPCCRAASGTRRGKEKAEGNSGEPVPREGGRDAA